MRIHIGKKIKEEVYLQKIPITVFAKKINRTRNVAYDIFNRESIDTELLTKICNVLNYDFFKIYKGKKEYVNSLPESIVNEDIPSFETKLKSELKMLRQQNVTLQKEIDYLKKILSLIESSSSVKMPKPLREGKKKM